MGKYLQKYLKFLEEVTNSDFWMDFIFFWTWSLTVQGHGVPMGAVEALQCANLSFFFYQYLDQDEFWLSKLKQTLEIVLDAMKRGGLLKIHLTKRALH